FTFADIPAFIVFVAFAAMTTWFSSIRRRVERNLRQARDELEVQVGARTRKASLLNLTHDTIMVRDLDFVISYWNRGAEELYGWKAEEAVGWRSDDLLLTPFPQPLGEIREELLRTGRWEG